MSDNLADNHSTTSGISGLGHNFSVDDLLPHEDEQYRISVEPEKVPLQMPQESPHETNDATNSLAPRTAEIREFQLPLQGSLLNSTEMSDSSADNHNTTSGISELNNNSSDDLSPPEDEQFGFSVRPGEVPLQGADHVLFESDRAFPRNVQSASASFEGLGTIDVERFKNKFLVGMRIPPAQTPRWVRIFLKRADGGELGETKIRYYDEDVEALKRVIMNPKLQAQVFRYQAETLDNHNTATFSGDEAQNSGICGSTQPVQTLCALVYAAAEIGGQQFIEMIFKSSAGRIVYDFYKERPPFPEAIAREYGYEKTAIYFEEITKRFSAEASEAQNYPQTIDWSELVRAAEEAQKESGLSTEEESSDAVKNAGYLGDIDTSSDKSCENVSSEFGDNIPLATSKGEDGNGSLTTEAMIASTSIASLVALKAIEICSEFLNLPNNTDQNSKEQFDSVLLQFNSFIYTVLFSANRQISDYKSAQGYGRELHVLYNMFAIVHYKLGKNLKAKEYVERALAITTEIGDRSRQASCYINLGALLQSLRKCHKAEEYLQKALLIATEIGNRNGEALCFGHLGTVLQSLGSEFGDREGEATDYGNLGFVFHSLGECDKDKEYLQKALVIGAEIGDREGEATDYENLGTVFHSVEEFEKAKEYLRKALAIKSAIGHRKGEASCYGNLGTVFQSLGQYRKAIEYLQKALVIRTEIGDREGEATDYGNLGTVFQSIGQFDKAKEYLQKALAIKSDIGDKKGEASCYGNLGTVFQSLGQYENAREYLQKALVIRTEIGDREGEATDYGNLGTVFHSLGEFDKAKEYLQKALAIKSESGDKKGEALCYGNLGTLFQSLGQYENAKKYLQKALVIRVEIGDRGGEATDYGNLSTVFESIGQFDKAKEYLQKALTIKSDIGDKKGEASCYGNLGTLFQSLGQYENAREYLQKALVIRAEIGDREGEATDYGNLGTVFHSLGEFDKAKEYLRKALAIKSEIGDRKGEATDYGNLGTVFHSLGEFDKAKEYLQKALTIKSEIGHRKGEATDYGNLGTVFHSLGKFDKAKEYLQKALVIRTEIGDKKGEALCYGNLGTLFQSLGQYENAKEYVQKALVIRTEIGDREGEATDYGNLGTVLQSIGQYDKAKEYLEKALAIRSEIGDKKGEALCYGNLGILFQSLGQYDNAKEYLQKAIVIRTEIGDRQGEATDYGNLGTVFQSIGQFDKAKEYLQKALAIKSDIGDKKGEATDYGNLGTVFQSIGQFDMAKEYLQKALAIKSDIGDRKGEASCYENLGSVCQSIGQYDKAIEHLQKVLVIRTEIGDRKGEASCYGNLGTVFQSLGQYGKAKEYLQKALVIRTEIGDKEGEAADLANLGVVFRIVADYETSEVYLEKALSISRGIGDRRKEFQILQELAILYSFQNKIKDSLSCLHLCIEKHEELRHFLGANDQFEKLFLEDSGKFIKKLLFNLLCAIGNTRDALYVEELGRARGLSDLMTEEYSVETHISVNSLSLFGIEDIFGKKNNCACLYISYFHNDLHFWILKKSGVHYKRISSEENLVQALSMFELQPLFPERNSSARLRLVEDDEDEEVISSLSLCYKMFVAPVYDLLEEPEVIIVPGRSLHKVPFAALREKEGAEYLSETHRIRVIPSLTALKIIQDSPEGYHNNTGALIVGNPKVDWLPPLPGARREAEMVGRLVGVMPLVEEEATKQAVLERISSVSLVHFAAHNNAESGEIALSPIPTSKSRNAIPPQEAYMLTMADVSRVKVRAKLVVLSCSHSGSGQIRAEGVTGIARAFLGCGARSVLVRLWAISDSATEQLMSRFYEHLVEGESASESLHLAMKWMRKNGFTKVSEWAPFTLIGDDVRLEFDKGRKKDPNRVNNENHSKETELIDI
nr:tetratricopeptide repeat protein 28-like [Pocillopora verrucosa]